MIKNIVNFLAVGGFIPFILTFYCLGDLLQQSVLTIAYFAVLALAIKLDDED